MKAIKIILSAVLAAGMCGCLQERPPEPAETPEPEETQEPEAVAGGWEVFDQIVTPVLTDEEKAIFESAMEGLTGVGYEPACVLATQVVAGMNYVYLAKGTTVTAAPKTGWYIVTVYNDQENKSSILSIKELEVPDFVKADSTPLGFLGGWQVKEESANAAVLPQNAHAAFNKAAEAWTGTALEPLGLLATQVVSGTNYMVLAKAQIFEETPDKALYVVTCYEDTSGNAEFTDVSLLDLEAYIEN